MVVIAGDPAVKWKQFFRKNREGVENFANRLNGETEISISRDNSRPENIPDRRPPA
jgi:hypothetical protein